METTTRTELQERQSASLALPSSEELFKRRNEIMPNKPTEWNKHVATTAKKTGMKFGKQLLKEAKKTYKKGGVKS